MVKKFNNLDGDAWFRWYFNLTPWTLLYLISHCSIFFNLPQGLGWKVVCYGRYGDRARDAHKLLLNLCVGRWEKKSYVF